MHSLNVCLREWLYGCVSSALSCVLDKCDFGGNPTCAVFFDPLSAFSARAID